jgi:hypothetical protein
MAGVVALVGAGLARLLGAGRADAAHDGSDESIIHANAINTTTSGAWISATRAGNPVVVSLNNYPLPIAIPDALQALTGFAPATGAVAAGVRGRSTVTDGNSRPVGVIGVAVASHGTGVYGHVPGDPSETPPSGTGVFGLAPSYGVVGKASGTGGIGVRGEASNGSGVDGRGREGVIGVGAETGFLGYSPNGVGARCDSDHGTGFLGVSPGGLAGRFVGRTIVEGEFTVFGGPKSAVVPHPDGHHRRLYCEESTESWFSDYGRATLQQGRAEVRLDRDFAAIVRADDYDVFLTPRGDCNGLYVGGQTPNGFEVRELKGGTSTLPFSYRVVAKRKDIPGPRLERVVVPQRPAPVPPRIRELPNRTPENNPAVPDPGPAPSPPRR